MDAEKVIDKLNAMKGRFTELKNVRYHEAKDEYYKMTEVLERIIDRIYPEKDAKSLKSKLHRGVWIAVEQSEVEEQKDFCYDTDLKLHIIDAILEEHDLFGFDDFKPLKEKKETEWQVGSEKIGGFFKKKTTK